MKTVGYKLLKQNYVIGLFIIVKNVTKENKNMTPFVQKYVSKR